MSRSTKLIEIYTLLARTTYTEHLSSRGPDHSRLEYWYRFDSPPFFRCHPPASVWRSDVSVHYALDFRVAHILPFLRNNSTGRARANSEH